MDDPSLLTFINNNGNGHHYDHEDMMTDNDIEHEEDEYDEDDLANGEEQPEEEERDDEEDEENPTYPEDEIDEDEIEEDEIDDREILPNVSLIPETSPTPPPPPPPPPSTLVNDQIAQSERGGRRKGVPRRLQLSPQAEKLAQIQQRLLPTATKNLPTPFHQPVDDENPDEDDEYPPPSMSLSSQFFSEHFIGHRTDDYDENNNHQYYDEENPMEIIDDILADLVNKIVQDIRQERRCQNRQTQRMLAEKMNGHTQSKPIVNGTRKIHEKVDYSKHLIADHSSSSNSIKSSKSQSQHSMPLPSSMKMSDSSTLLNELTKMIQPNGQQQLLATKQKHASSPSSSASYSSAKRPKFTETTLPLSNSPTQLSLQQQQQHQQLLLQMTQQFLMSTHGAELDSSSLLKQQLLGFIPHVPTAPKRPGRPPKQASQPQVMRSSTNMLPGSSHSANSTSSSFERGSFAPRRRGRPPKYVTERNALPTAHDLDPSSYEQLFAAIENSGNAAGQSPSAAFQSVLASMMGHQSGLSISNPLPSAIRNGTPASLMKQSAGQTRQTIPSSSTLSKPGKLHSAIPTMGGSSALDLPMMAPKKRGPGRPPKNQSLVDSHQTLQAAKRLSSSMGSTNNFPPTMVPSSSSTFDLNAALVEMFQQQQQNSR